MSRVQIHRTVVEQLREAGYEMDEEGNFINKEEKEMQGKRLVDRDVIDANRESVDVYYNKEEEEDVMDKTECPKDIGLFLAEAIANGNDLVMSKEMWDHVLQCESCKSIMYHIANTIGKKEDSEMCRECPEHVEILITEAVANGSDLIMTGNQWEHVMSCESCKAIYDRIAHESDSDTKEVNQMRGHRVSKIVGRSAAKTELFVTRTVVPATVDTTRKVARWTRDTGVPTTGRAISRFGKFIQGVGEAVSEGYKTEKK